MLLDDSGPQLSDEDVAAFEEHFRVTLPEDYVNFMKEHNGRWLVDELLFTFVETGYQETDSVMREFFVLNPTETNDEGDLRAQYRSSMENGDAPPYLMPIGDDPFGNLILLAVAGDDYGKVCFGNHELEDTETGYLVMSPIADSFTEFIEGLYPFEEEA
jgi:cell wall assembly regulator SMI1